MPVMKNVLGLDLGSHSLKAVEFRQTLRGLEAVQLRSLPRPADGTPLPELLRSFVQLHGLPTDQVVVSLPGDHISTRRLSFPFRERRKLSQAVPFAVEEELPFDLEDVVVDWEIIDGDRSGAAVLTAIAPRTEVSALLAELDSAGCAPRVLEAEGLVLGNLAATFDLAGSRLLADLGHSKSTLALLTDGRVVASRTVALGGRHLTEALAADRGLSLGDAERLKCEEGVFGGGAPPAQTAAVLDRLLREMLRTVGAFEELNGGPPDEITLFGGSSQLDRLDLFLGERSGLPTARLPLPPPGSDEGLVAGGPPTLFAHAIALGLRGTAQARTRINFRQDEFAVRLDVGRIVREFRATGWLAASVAALALVSFGTSVVLDSRRAGALEEQAERLYSEAFPGGEPPEAPLRALREQVGSANDRADFLGVYRGNLSALDLLTELSQLVPADLDIALEELSIDGQTVRMRVQAQSFQAADRLGTELARYRSFASSRIGAIETDSKTGGKRFSVTISLQSGEDRG